MRVLTLVCAATGALGSPALVEPPPLTDPLEGDVRLDGGIVDAALKTAEGRVEVYHNGVWGTVCDHGWRLTDAVVTCNQLGFRYGSTIWAQKAKTVKSLYGMGTGPVWLSDLKCNGDEKMLSDCPSFGWSVVGNCDHDGDAGAFCYNVEEPEPVADVATGDGTPCDSLCACYSCGSDTAQERVVAGFETCESLNQVGDYCSATAGNGNGCYTKASQKCDCTTGRSICPPPSPPYAEGNTIRLAGNGTEGTDTPSAGRVEIFHAGAWGTVCDNKWSAKDAMVTCKQLGFLNGQTVWRALGKSSKGKFGASTGPIWLDKVACDGYESVLSDCESAGWGVVSCDNQHEAGVVCSNEPMPPDPPTPPRPPPYSPGEAPMPPSPDPPAPPLSPGDVETLVVPVPSIGATDVIKDAAGETIEVANLGVLGNGSRALYGANTKHTSAGKKVTKATFEAKMAWAANHTHNDTRSMASKLHKDLVAQNASNSTLIAEKEANATEMLFGVKKISLSGVNSGPVTCEGPHCKGTSEPVLSCKGPNCRGGKKVMPW